MKLTIASLYTLDQTPYLYKPEFETRKSNEYGLNIRDWKQRMQVFFWVSPSSLAVLLSLGWLHLAFLMLFALLA